MNELTMDRLKENLESLKMKNTLEILDNYLERAVAEKLNVVDVLEHIFAEEAKSKRRRAYEKQIQMSGFPIKKTLDDFDFSFQPSIDKRQIDELATMRFLENGENVVFLGPPGVGKTHLASALGLVAQDTGFQPTTSTVTSSLNSSRKPTLRTGCRTGSKSCPSTGCLSLMRLDISLWTFRGPTCFSSSLQGGMKRHPRSLPLTRLFRSGMRCLLMSPLPQPFWTVFCITAQ